MKVFVYKFLKSFISNPFYYIFHHHHHVPEGLDVFPVP